jgi:steroid 5-alpha reductase family enzyme
MMENLFENIVFGWIILACATFLILLFVTAPYGRHTSRKWGITLSNRTGWILMEAPALGVFLFFFLTGKAEKNATVWIITTLFSLHYINRSLIYPFRIKTKGKQMPLLIVLMAVLFNSVNGFINGYYLGTLQDQYNISWLKHPAFIIGLLLFLAGMIINATADEKLIHLRKSSTNGYQIPYGGLFNVISCPNFFGEILEWLGFAIFCWSLPALSFFIWTTSNLVPRALDHHRWYRSTFANYPARRKAVIPFIL